MSTALTQRPSFLGPQASVHSTWDWSPLDHISSSDEDEDIGENIVVAAPKASRARLNVARVKDEKKSPEVIDFDDEDVVAPFKPRENNEGNVRRMKNEYEDSAVEMGDTIVVAHKRRAAQDEEWSGGRAAKRVKMGEGALPTPLLPARRSHRSGTLTGVSSLPWPQDRKPAGPFIIDDSSDVEDETAAPKLSTVPKTAGDVVVGLRAQREAQRLASERLRWEAMERRLGIAPRSHGDGAARAPMAKMQQSIDRGAGLAGAEKKSARGDVRCLGSSIPNREPTGKNFENVAGREVPRMAAEKPNEVIELDGDSDTETKRRTPKAIEVGGSSSSVKDRRPEVVTKNAAATARKAESGVTSSGAIKPPACNANGTARGVPATAYSTGAAKHAGQAGEHEVPKERNLEIPKNHPHESEVAGDTFGRMVHVTEAQKMRQETTDNTAANGVMSKATQPATVVYAAPAAQSSHTAGLQKPAPTQLSADAQTAKAAAEAEAERQRRIRAENSRKRNEARAAQLKAQNEAAERAEQVARDAQLRRERGEAEKEEQALREVEANIAAEAKQREAEKREQDAWRLQAQMRLNTEAKRKQHFRLEIEAGKLAGEKEVRVGRVEGRRRVEEMRVKQREAREAVARRVGGGLAGLGAAQRDGAVPTSSHSIDTKASGVSAAYMDSTTTRTPQVPQSTEADQSRQQRIQAMKERNARNQLDDKKHDEYEVPEEDDRDVEQIRHERIQAIKDRNARNRQAAEDEEHAGDEEEGLSAMAVQPKAAGPVSLNSLAGQAALARMAPPGLQRAPSVTTFRRPSDEVPGRQSHSHGRALGNILPNDVKLVRWKDSGMNLETLSKAFEQETGVKRAPKTLSKRANQVRDALDAANISEHLLDLVEAGDDAAIRQLNDVVTGSGQSKNSGYSTSLGEITTEDMQLLRWKDGGMTFEDIVPAYEQITGRKRSPTTLWMRYKMIKAAIDRPDVEQSLLDDVEAGDLEAKERLNMLADQPRPHPKPPVVEPKLTKPSLQRELGEILPSDIMLLKWRDEGMLWSTIVEAYQQFTGREWSDTTLRDRYRPVKAAIESHGADQVLLDRVAADDAEAREELNRWIHGTWPVPKPKIAMHRPKGQAKAGASGGSLAFRNTVGGPAQSGSFSTSFDSSCTLSSGGRSNRSFGVSTPLAGEESFRATNHAGYRPTTGGETINETAFQYYLAAVAEAHVEESETEENEDEDEIDDEDLCHFVYQVQRREITKEELDEDMELEDLEWLDCGNPYTKIVKANAQATKQVAISNNADTLAALIIGGSLERNTDENGLVFATHNTKDSGTVEVRVERRLRTYKRGVRPNIDETWVPREVYFVKERTIRKVLPEEGLDPEVFGEEPERREIAADVNVDNAVYTTLELANLNAINYLLKLSLHFETSNLDQRTLQMNEMRNGFLRELQQEESDGLFRQAAEAEDGSMEVEVRVEKGRLRGPRNF